MCTSVIVGKKATSENVTLIARNEDCQRSNWNKNMVFRNKPEYQLNQKTVVHDQMWTLGNGLRVPVPDNAFSYNGMPDARGYQEANNTIGDRFYFEERGINEKNVAISATNSMNNNKKANTADPLLESGGIAEAIIPTLLLPQITSARHGVELLGSYVQTHGASEANGILFADCEETWYFEIGSRQHWIAVRVPDDHYMVVSNSMRVHDVNLGDPDTVLYSEGLFEFVTHHQLLEQADRKHFDFAGAFGVLGDSYNVDRLWLAQRLLTPSLQQKTRLNQYPMFLEPDSLISVKDVMRVLTATYKDTELEGKADRPIGWLKTAESHIITLNATQPEPLRGMIWQAVSTPLCSPYLPLFHCMREIPIVYSLGSNDFGTQSAYWAFRGLYSLAKDHGEESLNEANEHWDNYVSNLLSEYPFIQEIVADMYRSSPESALAFAERYSYGVAQHAVSKANAQRNQLMTQITIEDDPPGRGL